MGASVKPETTPHILSFDEWQATQYAPHRADQTDPTKPMGQGRILMFDEWQKAQAAGNPSALQFPAMPKIASDRLNKTAGTPLPGQYQMGPTPEQQAGAAIRTAAAGLDVAGAGLNPVQAGVTAALGRQVVAPAVENPAMTAAMLNPVGAIVGFGMAAHTVAKYGWQVASEHFMSPEDRAKAEADPNRVSGEAAAVQAAMLGLGFLAGVHGVVSKAADVSEGVTETGAKALQPYFESPKGAETLGTAAAAHGLPETASPFPPATELDQAWRQGHAATAPTGLNVAPEGATPPAGATPEDLGQGVKSATAAEPTASAEGQPAPLAPVEGTGATKTRGLAAGVEAKAVENKLTTGLGELPEYRQVSMADQARQATDLIAKDPDLARRVATGEAPAPEGVLPEAVFTAVENRALEQGDVATIRDLASSKLTEQATTMGQRIRALGERDPDSPVSAIQQVEQSRGGGTAEGGKAVDDATTELLKETAKAHPDVLNETTLTKLINSLRC